MQVDQSVHEQIEIFISGRNLHSHDSFSKSDPFVKLFLKNGTGQSIELGRTEKQKNDANPNFERSFQIDFIFEMKQLLKVEFWDSDTFDNDDLIGFHEVEVGCVVGSRDQVYQAEIQRNNQKQGEVLLKSEKAVNSNMFVWWQWAGEKLLDTDFFSKSDPFLKFFKMGQSGKDFLLVHQTETIMDNLNPIFQPFELNLGKLCFNDQDRVFRVECWDWQSSGKHQYIGYLDITLNSIFSQNQTSFQLVNKTTSANAGRLFLKQKVLKEKPSFVDYIAGGIQINLAVAIDFTASNGNMQNKDSLHRLHHHGALNEYQSALHQVCDILLNYDHDQRVPVYGFGGVPNFKHKTEVDHCFPLTGDSNQAEVYGLQGVLDAYYEALKMVKLGGPTLFAPVVQAAMKFAQANLNTQNYTVLLILTDGENHDTQTVLDLLISASNLPLSIIIVGVGKESFKNMKILDGDEGLKSHLAASGSKGQVRDLVQFVRFQQYINNHTTQMAQDLLAELPNQLVSYYQMKGIQPVKPKFIDLSLIQAHSDKFNDQYQDQDYDDQEYEDQDEQDENYQRN